jgi:hypothetical protein
VEEGTFVAVIQVQDVKGGRFFRESLFVNALVLRRGFRAWPAETTPVILDVIAHPVLNPLGTILQVVRT